MDLSLYFRARPSSQEYLQPSARKSVFVTRHVTSKHTRSTSKRTDSRRLPLALRLLFRGFMRFALPLLILAFGCGTTVRFVETNPGSARRPSKNPAKVQVYSSQPPKAPYTEIGILHARQSSPYSLHQLPEVLRELRAKAGRVGCDAIIIGGTDNAAESELFSELVTTQDGYWATCIVLTPSQEKKISSAGSKAKCEDQRLEMTKHARELKVKHGRARALAASNDCDEAHRTLSTIRTEKAEYYEYILRCDKEIVACALTNSKRVELVRAPAG
jgi:hypothetical protein